MVSEPLESNRRFFETIFFESLLQNKIVTFSLNNKTWQTLTKDKFNRGLHSFLLLAPKMAKFYQTSFICKTDS